GLGNKALDPSRLLELLEHVRDVLAMAWMLSREAGCTRRHLVRIRLGESKAAATNEASHYRGVQQAFAPRCRRGDGGEVRGTGAELRGKDVHLHVPAGLLSAR